VSTRPPLVSLLLPPHRSYRLWFLEPGLIRILEGLGARILSTCSACAQVVLESGKGIWIVGKEVNWNWMFWVGIIGWVIRAHHSPQCHVRPDTCFMAAEFSDGESPLLLMGARIPFPDASVPTGLLTESGGLILSKSGRQAESYEFSSPASHHHHHRQIRGQAYFHVSFFSESNLSGHHVNLMDSWGITWWRITFSPRGN